MDREAFNCSVWRGQGLPYIPKAQKQRQDRKPELSSSSLPSARPRLLNGPQPAIAPPCGKEGWSTHECVNLLLTDRVARNLTFMGDGRDVEENALSIHSCGCHGGAVIVSHFLVKTFGRNEDD